MKIHSSCEIEDFVETHLCKLCVILRSYLLRISPGRATDPAAAGSVERSVGVFGVGFVGYFFMLYNVIRDSCYLHARFWKHFGSRVSRANVP